MVVVVIAPLGLRWRSIQLFVLKVINILLYVRSNKLYFIIQSTSNHVLQDAIIDAVVKRQVKDIQSAVIRNRTMIEGLVKPLEATTDEPTTLIHHVAAHDTLAGIAIKYSGFVLRSF